MVRKWYLCVTVHCTDACSRRGSKAQYFFLQSDKTSFIPTKILTKNTQKIHTYVYIAQSLDF
jgi:hypothetical protein